MSDIKWWSYDPSEKGLVEHATQEDAEREAQTLLVEHEKWAREDGEWHGDERRIRWGRIEGGRYILMGRVRQRGRMRWIDGELVVDYELVRFKREREIWAKARELAGGRP